MIEGGHNLAKLFHLAQPSELVLVTASLHRFAFERWLQSLGQKEQVVHPFDFVCTYKANTTTVNSFKHERKGETRRGRKEKKNASLEHANRF